MRTLTQYGYVGNVGCIRFPQPVRKAAGVKRGDRLAVLPQPDGSIVLEVDEVPRDLDAESVTVDGCACEQPPELCGRQDSELVTVGWSYVQLNKQLAAELGFVADAPLRIVADPGQITVMLHDDPADLEGVERLRCPPGPR